MIYPISQYSNTFPNSFLTRWLQLSAKAYNTLKLHPYTFFTTITSSTLVTNSIFLSPQHGKPTSICSWLCPMLTPTKTLLKRTHSQKETIVLTW